MKFAIPQCPECGELACGASETVPATASLSFDEDTGEFDYSGDADCCWDAQESVKNEKGQLELTCGSHTWWSDVLPDDAEQVIPERWTLADQDKAEDEGWNVFNADSDPVLEADSDCNEFTDNDAAVRFVTARAKRGSELHAKALRVCGLPEQAANARLIEKAPELAAMLADVTSAAENMLLHHGKNMPTEDVRTRARLLGEARMLLYRAGVQS